MLKVEKENSKKLSQYYTKIDIAKKCIEEIKTLINLKEYIIVEPSAGTGSFCDFITEYNKICIDIEPKNEKIIKMDYFDFVPKKNLKYIVIGNPPFGKNSNLAIKFFNHSDYSDYICFILPKTFKKPSVINRLNPYFHLKYENDLPLNSFIFNNKEYSVPCVFQIWKKEKIKREKIKIKTKSSLITFSDENNFDYLIRRVGGLAGKVIEDNFDKYSPNSHYYIKSSFLIKKLIKDNFKSLNTISKNTSGNPSLSKHEIIELIENLTSI